MEQKKDSKTGLKTIDHISEIQFVNSSLSELSNYYGKVKEKNILFKTSLNLAEFSFKTIVFATSPITTIFKRPIESVDLYLLNKIKDLEQSIPNIVNSTNLVKSSLISRANLLHSKLVSEPMDKLNNMKQKTTDFSCKVVDACLENQYTKKLTDPVFDVTEKSLDYWLQNPIKKAEETIEAKKTEKIDFKGAKTLKRLNHINNKLYNLSVKQFEALNDKLKLKFNKLSSFKQIRESMFQDSIEKLHSGSAFINSISKNAFKQYINLVDMKNILSFIKNKENVLSKKSIEFEEKEVEKNKDEDSTKENASEEEENLENKDENSTKDNTSEEEENLENKDENSTKDNTSEEEEPEMEVKEINKELKIVLPSLF